MTPISDNSLSPSQRRKGASGASRSRPGLLGFGAGGASDDALADQEIDEAALVLTTRSKQHMVQRLQIGLAGLVVVLLVVGLANVVVDQLRQEEAALAQVTPEAEPDKEEETQPTDPLVDAGVVPDLPAEPSAEQTENEKLPAGGAAPIGGEAASGADGADQPSASGQGDEAKRRRNPANRPAQ